jgi:hypothetical protein
MHGGNKVVNGAARDPKPLSQAIASTMPLGSVGYEAEVGANGERLIWLAAKVVRRLRAFRRPGKSYSDAVVVGRFQAWAARASKLVIRLGDID